MRELASWRRSGKRLTPEQIIGVLRQAEVELAQGQTVSEMAAGEGIERGYLGTLLRLMLLAPDIVEAIIDGRQPAGMALLRLLAPFPVGWSAQRMAIELG